MPDFLTEADRSALMKRVKSKGTRAEATLAEALRAARFKPSEQAEDLPGIPDIVFRRDRLAVFVDGDLWHANQWRSRNLSTLSDQFANAERREYWIHKINRNIRRDLHVTSTLLKQGWSVLRFWESDVEKDPEACVRMIRAAKRHELDPDPLATRTASAASCDFFAGIGLMSKGLEAAGWRTIWANDHCPTKRRIFLHNHNASEGNHAVDLDARPIQDVSAEDLPDAATLAVCFPCTDLSLAGAQRGIERGRESSAFLAFASLLHDLQSRRPPFVVLENVPGLLTSHDGADFRLCISHLAEAGYDLDAAVLDARHFTPQSRRRLFIVATRTEINEGPFLEPDALVSPARPRELLGAIDATADLPWRCKPLPPLPEPRTNLREILEDLPHDDPAWWSRDRVRKFEAQISDRHRETASDLLRSEGHVVVTAFRRMRKGKSTAELRFDGIAGCLRTPKGGSAKQIVAFLHEDGWRVRHLTARECARLMGAGTFRLDAEGVKATDYLFGFGDAVVVPAATWMLTNLVNPTAAAAIRGRFLQTTTRR